MDRTNGAKPASLPHEAHSPAALLSSTHLFVVEIRAVTGPVWSATVYERDLHLDLIVRAIYKGELSDGANQAFSLTVKQRNPPEGGYHGTWSHVQPEPAAGVTYLVLASGTAHEPAALLVEPALQHLLPGNQADDVRLAIQAEELWNATLSATIEANARRAEGERVDPRQAATTRVIEFTNAQRSSAGRLYGEYLWARIGRTVYDRAPGAISKLLEIVGAPDAGTGLRGALADQMLQVAITAGGEVRIKVGRTLLLVLTLPAAAPLRGKLIDGSLPALLLPEDGTPDPAANVVPDAADRRKVHEVLAGHDTEEARRLLQWLDATRP